MRGRSRPSTRRSCWSARWEGAGRWWASASRPRSAGAPGQPGPACDRSASRRRLRQGLQAKSRGSEPLSRDGEISSRRRNSWSLAEAITGPQDNATPILLRLWRLDLIDLGRQDEVVVGEPAGGVGPQLHRDVAPPQEQIRMVALRLGDRGDAVDEIEGGHEALELDGPGQQLVAVSLRHGPAGQLGEQAGD